MSPHSWWTRAGRACTGACLAVLLSAPAGAQTGLPLAGRRLDEALRTLQALGLPIIFTSELVTSDLKVEREPRRKDLRDRLIELLTPHGLGVVDGPGGTVLVVREKRRKAATPPPPVRRDLTDVDDVVQPVSPIHVEQVLVEAPVDLRSGSHPLPDHRLASMEVMELGGYTVDDPVRAAQALAGVAAGDDFRNDLSVRGSLPRHAAVVVDGVTVSWLQHAAEGRGDSGAVTMIGSDVVSEVALRVGGYARQDAGQIGPQLNLTVREGSRAATRVSATASTTGTRTTAEGPIGSRGSWLVGARRSTVEWPVGRQDHDRTVFGYLDVQSKLVFDLRSTDQLSATIVAGVSNLERDDPRPAAMADGINHATMATMAWRSIVGSRTVLRHQVSVATHGFSNHDNTRRPVNEGTDGAAAYRFDLTRPVAGALFQAGLQVRRVSGTWRNTSPDEIALVAPAPRADVDRSWLERAIHASVRWQPVPRLTVAPGVRFAHSTLVERRATDRWLEMEWAMAPRWTVYGNAAVVHQFADREAAAGWSGQISLAPERARLLEIGVGHQPSRKVRWRATVFARRDDDLLSASSGWPRLQTAAPQHAGAVHFQNALTGQARGLEVAVDTPSAAAFSGRAAYTYAVARYTDPRRGMTFDADRDQRHIVTASVTWSLPRRTRLGASFRAGSPIPLPGYLVATDGGLFLGDRPNGVRLPAYARLDVRAERTFTAVRSGLTLFAEVLNVLGRANDGNAAGWLQPGSGEVQGATERLYPRLATLGVRIGF